MSVCSVRRRISLRVLYKVAFVDLESWWLKSERGAIPGTPFFTAERHTPRPSASTQVDPNEGSIGVPLEVPIARVAFGGLFSQADRSFQCVTTILSALYPWFGTRRSVVRIHSPRRTNPLP